MNFDKSKLTWDGMYMMYVDGTTRQFVARFKHNKRDRANFTKFLIKNFTTTEYFALRDQGMTPIGILRTKGYVSTSQKMAQTA